MTAGFAYLYNDLKLFSKDDATQPGATERMRQAKGDDIYDVYAHGNENAIMNDKSFMSPDDLANLIKADGNYHSGMTIKLWACNTGRLDNGFAQQLANSLKTTVIAPDTFVYYPKDGDLHATHRTTEILGNRVRNTPLDAQIQWWGGNWKTFLPQNN